MYMYSHGKDKCYERIYCYERLYIHSLLPVLDVWEVVKIFIHTRRRQNCLSSSYILTDTLWRPSDVILSIIPWTWHLLAVCLSVWLCLGGGDVGLDKSGLEKKSIPKGTEEKMNVLAYMITGTRRNKPRTWRKDTPVACWIVCAIIIMIEEYHSDWDIPYILL